ncbi:MAG TPA: extracellular solute-binding protein [Chloroflexota bacterium]
MKVISTLIGPYEQAHPGAKVDVIAVYGSGVEEMAKLTTLFAGGTPPDVIKWTGAAQLLGQVDFLAPLDPFVARDKYDLGAYSPAILDIAGRYQGKLYALPFAYGGNGVAMVYNRALFKKAGLAEPPTKWGDDTWTWETMLAIAQKLNKVTGTTFEQVGLTGPGYYMDLPALWKTSWITTDEKTIVCDSAEMIDCYTRFGDLSAKYHVSPKTGDQTPKDGFQGGLVGLSTIGGWEFTSYAKVNSLDFGFAPFPKVTVSGSQVNATIVQLGKGAKNLEGGWSLMQYLIAGSRQALFENRVPLTSDAITTWANGLFSGKDVRIPVLVDAITQALPDDRILFTKNWSAMSKPVGTAITAVTDGKTPAETALRGLKPQLQALLS